MQGNSGEVGWKIGSRGNNKQGEDARTTTKRWKQHAAPTPTMYDRAIGWPRAGLGPGF